MRGVLGILAGLVVVAVTILVVSFVGSQLVPAPPEVNTSSIESIRATYAALGTETWLLMLVSWFLGALAGAAVAKKVGGRSWAAWTIAGLVFAYLLLTVAMLPMPGWMMVSSLAAPLLAGFLANRLIPERPYPPAGEAGDERGGEETAADADA
ncbi:MAG TPA: hypothetical protein VGR19_03345 [Allosphingosinicella sp.]|nr:hypothetical protein [Allosphingosinicella sp.]